MSQSVYFLPETQKRIFKNISYVNFSREKQPKCDLFWILQLAPPALVLLLELTANKALRVMLIFHLKINQNVSRFFHATSSPCTRITLRAYSE